MADALGSGPSGSNPLEVQVLSSVLGCSVAWDRFSRAFHVSHPVTISFLASLATS